MINSGLGNTGYTTVFCSGLAFNEAECKTLVFVTARLLFFQDRIMMCKNRDERHLVVLAETRGVIDVHHGAAEKMQPRLSGYNAIGRSCQWRYLARSVAPVHRAPDLRITDNTGKTGGR